MNAYHMPRQAAQRSSNKNMRTFISATCEMPLNRLSLITYDDHFQSKRSKSFAEDIKLTHLRNKSTRMSECEVEIQNALRKAKSKVEAKAKANAKQRREENAEAKQIQK